MELRHLRYFVAVAEDLSFRRAAERLNIAQPPLSAQIKALESELGVQLFLRSTRAVKLTSAGEVFLVEARDVLAAAQRAEQRVRHADQGLIGTLRLGFLPPTATPHFAGILRNYRKQFPNVELSLHELTSVAQFQQLRADKLDIGLVRGLMLYPELETRFFESSAAVLAVPAGHRFAKVKTIQWSDFHNEKLVLIHPSVQHGYYDNFLSLCAKAGATPVVSQYANDVHSIKWLVSAGFGVAPMTQTLTEVKRPGLVFRELPPGLPKIEFVIAWKRTNSSPVLRSFLERVVD